MGEVGAVRSDKRAANHNGEKGGQINEAKGIFGKVGCGASIEKISDTSGNGDRHAYCCGSGNGVTDKIPIPKPAIFMPSVCGRGFSPNVFLELKIICEAT